MLTKKDLLAIQSIVNSSATTVKSELRKEMRESTSNIISTLRKEIGNNTNDLIDLIKVGFHLTDDLDIRLIRVEKKVYDAVTT